MRRKLKKLCCSILCTCLLIINTPGSMSYAENAEQCATDTDATYTTYVEGTIQAATGTDALPSATVGDAENIYASSVTAEDVLLYAAATVGDALLYAASPDVPEDGYKIEINSQDEWNSLFKHTPSDGSGWAQASEWGATYIGDENSVVIILNTDITLPSATYLTIPKEKFLLLGNGHSIDIGGGAYPLFMVQAATTIAIDNVDFKNGKVQVEASSSANGISISNCKFSSCSDPCVYSTGGVCPVSFSDCIMDNCGLLFKTKSTCPVSFSGITATNCTGTVFGEGMPDYDGAPYIIKSISGCELSTSETGITAIDQYGVGIEEITGCTITGFDTGIKMERINVMSFGIDTLTIDDIAITDCITGVDIQNLMGYNKATISNLTMEAREGASNTVGFNGISRLQSTYISDDYDLKSRPQIKGCIIKGFDTSIKLDGCQVVVSDCTISDCKEGINMAGDLVAIVNTTLTARASAVDSAGVTAARSTCFLIDCDINDFDIGSDMSATSNNATIISCKYQSKDTNLICAGSTSVYDTSFTGGKTSVSMRFDNNSTSYFYNCVVKGEPSITTGFSNTSISPLYIYSLDHPYHLRSDGYEKLEKYSDRTVNAKGKSEIYDCEIGVDTQNRLNIADTDIYNCGTGIKSTSDTYSYGNNLIEDCKYGMEVKNLYKNTDNQSPTTTLDTIRRCSEDGLLSNYGIYSYPQGWENRLEIYECGNGIKTSGSITSITVDVHNCKTGIYIAETASTTILDSDSEIYNNEDWNVYDGSEKNWSQLIFQGSKATLTDGGEGNIYFDPSLAENKSVRITTQTLHSDDSVYYLGSDTGFYTFTDTFKNLDGTIVFDTIEAGYYDGRKVAELKTDITSQMFAKKDGYVIKYEEDDDKSYAVLREGYDVTYDVTTNGGDTFDGEKLSDDEIKDGKRKRISYLNGDPVDLTYTASKTDYEFVGWNTDKDAKVGLDTLTVETEDITLYAIYKKTVDINYHTYDVASDYKTTVTFYNNEDEIEHGLATYNAGGDNTFAGYVLNENADVSSADDLMNAGDNVTVSLEGLDVYCVYSKQGQLNYLKKDGTTLSTDSKTVYQICTDNKEFEYTVRAGEPVTGFTFKGWKDAAGTSYAAGATISTMESSIVLTPVYEESTTEDCNVTYNVTANGGGSFSGGSLTQISYPNGDPVDLTYTASKTGYEFVGWNTNQNAKVGLATLTAGTEDITLYAIYKKTAYISYHTYNAASDYRTAVTFYNNEDEIERGLATYNAGEKNTFVGYVLNENATVSSADTLKKAGDNVTVSPSGLNVYCVYEKQGQLKYLKKDGTTLSTESKTVYQISTHTKKFVYTVRAGQSVTGFTFKGWKDAAGTSYAAGATISTTNGSIVLTPVYVAKEKPTTEEPT
ncbi:MAG: InlB B-repeat-containing protein, partial [Lachnospiraceae bacterium]|nr:InlB B-repeat-containing protein [Lachnospiraceae bacterium]